MSKSELTTRPQSREARSFYPKDIMKHPKTVLERYQAIQKIGTEIEIPFYSVSRIIHGAGERRVSITGDQIDLGGTDSDFASLAECRAAIEWYVEQLGGKVQWLK